MAKERLGLVLNCEGLGDCLYAMPVIKSIHQALGPRHVFDIFTHQPALFAACPYIDQIHPLTDNEALRRYASAHRTMSLFDLSKMPHWAMDTIDFINIPLGVGQLSFRQKQLEYFPVETDQAQAFDVVLNTSMTWPTRSWPLAHWQRLAQVLLARGLNVAVVGKAVQSKADNMEKRAYPLEGCHDLVDKLSLDQTYFTLAKCGLFVSCQNGLSVLAGATECNIMVLDMSIDWSKRALYRHENPLYKFSCVKGNCDLYCGQGYVCPDPSKHGQLLCIPTYEQVEAAVLARLGLSA